VNANTDISVNATNVRDENHIYFVNISRIPQIYDSDQIQIRVECHYDNHNHASVGFLKCLQDICGFRHGRFPTRYQKPTSDVTAKRCNNTAATLQQHCNSTATALQQHCNSIATHWKNQHQMSIMRTNAFLVRHGSIDE